MLLCDVRRRCAARVVLMRLYLDNGRVVNYEDVLDSYCGNLSDEDAAERVGDTRVNANHVKLHDFLIKLINDDLKVILKLRQVPAVVHIHAAENIGRCECVHLEGRRGGRREQRYSD